MSSSEPRQGRGRRPGDTSVGGWVGKNIPPAERQSFRQAIRRAALRQKEQSEAQSPHRGRARRAGGSGGDRIQWMKQEAAAGAALRFLQAGTAPRRKNRLSARGFKRVVDGFRS